MTHVKCTLKWCNQKQTFTFDDFSQKKIVRMIIFSSGFLLAKNQVLHILIDCKWQLLLIKIYTGISNIFKKAHHLLKLWAANKGIKQMLFLLFLNFLTWTIYRVCKLPIKNMSLRGAIKNRLSKQLFCVLNC